MDYVLINDDCDTCKYVSNAFTLLNFPLKKLTLDDLASAADPTTVIVCQNTEKDHKKQIDKLIDSNDIFLISFNEHTLYKEYANKPIYFLTMPFSQYELKSALLHCQQYQHGFTNLLNTAHPIFDKLVGQSQQIEKIKSMILQVAYSDTTVLILGQSGTGKDVIASCIHHLSTRNNHPLVPINCGAIPSELMESELFGHEKGAFTGAVTRRAGRFEMAEGGTLFLDEIGDMPLPMQVKLLRVIQEKTIERVGGTCSSKVDVRIIAATNQHLEELIQQNRFREDLFYRLNVFPIYVPSLSERAEDIPLLIDYHLDKIYARLKHRVLFTEKTLDILCHYSWPGNIRELQNFLERMVILYPDRVADENDIEIVKKQKKSPVFQPLPLLQNNGPFNIKEYIASIEQQIIKNALEQANGAVSTAAQFLSLSRNTLAEKIKKYNLVLQDD